MGEAFIWGTDFEGIDKQDLAVELGLIFFCAAMTGLSRAKTEYILAYRASVCFYLF